MNSERKLLPDVNIEFDLQAEKDPISQRSESWEREQFKDNVNDWIVKEPEEYL